MAVLATELGLAGVQVLIELYGWSQAEADQWLEAWIARATENRQAREAGRPVRETVQAVTGHCAACGRPLPPKPEVTR
jgi:hypothetical protein